MRNGWEKISGNSRSRMGSDLQPLNTMSSSRSIRLGLLQPQDPGHHTFFCNDGEANAPVKFRENIYFVIYILMSTFYFYFTLLLVPIFALFGDFIYLGIQRWFFPYDYQIIQEMRRNDAENYGRAQLLEELRHCRS